MAAALVDEVEVEAALLALGGVLRWTRQQNRYGNDGAFLSIGQLPGSDGREYTIEEPCRANFNYHTVISHGYPHAYESLDAAKLACERHHTTGKWE